MKNILYTLVVFGLICNSLTLASDDDTKKTAEDAAWKKVDKMDPNALTSFLETFPQGKYAEQAKFDLSLHSKIEDIKSGKLKNTFIIPFDKLAPRWEYWKKQKPDKDAVGVYRNESTAGMFRSIGSGIIQTDGTGMIITPTGHGSILAIQTFGLPYSYISKDIIFQSNKGETLYFGVVEGNGLAHLSGKGKVKIGDKEIVLTDVKETYEEVDPDEFVFVIQDFYHNSVVAEENGQLVGIPIGGKIGSLLVNDRKIELVKNEFDDGFLVTKQFGRIKVRTSRSVVSPGFSIYMTSSQKKALREFLGHKKSTDAADQTAGSPVAEEYKVCLLRPAKAGDEYRMQASCHQSEKIKVIKGGQEVKTSDVEFSLELEAGVRILEVNTTGIVTKFSLSVTNFIKTQGEVKTIFIPKDSLVMGYVDDAGIGFTVNGNPVSLETLQALCAVIQLGKGGRWSDDEIYESKEPQKVGNSWKINSAVAARNLAKTGLKAQANAITGTATLEEITIIEDTPCLKVRGEMYINGMSAPSIPDFEIESAKMHMAYSATFPVDITKGRISESQEMRMTCSMRGKPDGNGLGVLVQSTAQRTLTTRMDYPK